MFSVVCEACGRSAQFSMPLESVDSASIDAFLPINWGVTGVVGLTALKMCCHVCRAAIKSNAEAHFAQLITAGIQLDPDA